MAIQSTPALRVRAFENGFGAAVTGLNLRRPLETTEREALLGAFASHCVLVFPDQDLGLDELETFTLQIGPFGEDPFVAPLPGHPNVLEVRREPEETGVLFGGAWHSDWSFLATPPAATLLHARVIPPVGGDTLYADGVRAYEALPTSEKARLNRLRATHSARHAYGPNGALAKDEGKRGMNILISSDAESTQSHPLVRLHPVTGRKALFVNPVYTIGIEGMDPGESGDLLKSLYAHMVSDEFIYRHHWAENMLVMWDNRCVMHNALGGYEGHRRLLHRTTVGGSTVE